VSQDHTDHFFNFSSSPGSGFLTITSFTVGITFLLFGLQGRQGENFALLASKAVLKPVLTIIAGNGGISRVVLEMGGGFLYIVSFGGGVVNNRLIIFFMIVFYARARI
jgi:hypothetical protein